MTVLTIIMPTYNGARYLRPQLDSILTQSHEDFELLVADDGSSDDSVGILDEYAARDRRIRRIPTTGNRGQRRRLFDLAEMVQTPFVAIADQDDVWHPLRNERLLAAIGDKALAFGHSQLIDGQGNDLGRSIMDALRVDPERFGPLTGLFHSFVSAHAAIFRRDWYDPAVFFGTAPFDYVMGLEAMLSRGLAYVDTAVVYHRLHGGNQMNSDLAHQAVQRIISRNRLRQVTGFVRTDRLEFFRVLDQLRRSAAVSAEVRRVFTQAMGACRYAWFQHLDFRWRRAAPLERELHDLLDPYAASEADRRYFAHRIRSIVRGQWDPVNIGRAIALYRREIARA